MAATNPEAAPAGTATVARAVADRAVLAGVAEAAVVEAVAGDRSVDS